MKNTTILSILIALAPSVKAYTETEIVAATLILEAGGEYSKGSMNSVREVIRNRSVKTKKSESAVCLKPKQFSCWNGVAPAAGIAKAKKHPRWKLALEIAKGPVGNITKGADHYHTISINPKWNVSMVKTTTVGQHVFYRS